MRGSKVEPKKTGKERRDSEYVFELPPKTDFEKECESLAKHNCNKCYGTGIKARYHNINTIIECHCVSKKRKELKDLEEKKIMTEFKEKTGSDVLENLKENKNV